VLFHLRQKEEASNCRNVQQWRRRDRRTRFCCEILKENWFLLMLLDLKIFYYNRSKMCFFIFYHFYVQACFVYTITLKQSSISTVHSEYLCTAILNSEQLKDHCWLLSYCIAMVALSLLTNKLFIPIGITALLLGIT